MPFKSKAQWRHMFAAERRGEVPSGTAERFAHETTRPFAALPEREHHSPVAPSDLADLLAYERFDSQHPKYTPLLQTGHDDDGAHDTVFFVATCPNSIVAHRRYHPVIYAVFSYRQQDGFDHYENYTDLDTAQRAVVDLSHGLDPDDDFRR